MSTKPGEVQSFASLTGLSPKNFFHLLAKLNKLLTHCNSRFTVPAITSFNLFFLKSSISLGVISDKQRSPYNSIKCLNPYSSRHQDRFFKTSWPCFKYSLANSLSIGISASSSSYCFSLTFCSNFESISRARVLVTIPLFPNALRLIFPLSTYSPTHESPLKNTLPILPTSYLEFDGSGRDGSLIM